MKTNIENIRNLRADYEAQFEKTRISKPIMRSFKAAQWGFAVALLQFYGRSVAPLPAQLSVTGKGDWTP